jgi:UDP-N-acetyl-D-mannosaminuronate dehydrogenase
MFTADELIRYGFEASSVADAGARLVILNTAHPEFEAPDFRLWASKGVKAILDGRNFWDREQIETAGIFYFGIGNGATRR